MSQWVIVAVAILISFLVNLPRIFTVYRVSSNLINESFTPASVKDIIIRVFFLFIFSWLVLQINTNWRNHISNYKRTVRGVIMFVANLAVILITVETIVFVYPVMVGEVIKALEIDIFYYAYFIVFLILFFIARVLRYQLINQKQLDENEELKQENLKNELVALQNQVDPHFLFNSLNSLNSLIRDNKEATMFVNKLSFMYRYILQSGDSDLVTIRAELKFLESYKFLIKTRYRDRFEMDVNIEKEYLDRQVPPLALQLLVENAVKHNEISENNPLFVEVFSIDGYICVENKIKLRSTFVDSTGNGLSNLNKRYLLLKGAPIQVNNEKGVFSVKFKLN